MNVKGSKNNKKVTLSVDAEIYDAFRDHCEENAIMMSKKIEIWMQEELQKNRHQNYKTRILFG